MEWISVEDRLPENWGQWYRYQAADEYNSDSPYFSDYDIEITHWMPLPEHPDV